MAILNTHAVVKKFTQHGFTEEHAELIVDAINDQNDHSLSVISLLYITSLIEYKLFLAYTYMISKTGS